MTNPVGLATTIWGDGPRRGLLLHGLTSAASTWWRVGPALADMGFTVVAPDLRGHGRSPAGDSLAVAAFVDDLLILDGGGWDLLIGHSLGGTIAAALVTHHPGFTRKVVYEDPAVDWELAAEFVTTSLEPVGTATTSSIAAEHPDWHPEDVKHKVEALNSCRRDVQERTVADAVLADYWTQMIESRMPGLVIAADIDIGSLVSAEQEKQAIGTELEVVRIAGAGHSVHRDAFPEFMTAVAGWVGGSWT